MRFSKRSVAAVVAALISAMACSTDVASPTVPSRPVGSLSGVASLFNVQIRAVPPNPIVPPNPTYGWGHLQIRLSPLDPCVPPNPIVPAGLTVVAVCGKIFNDGGVRYVDGGLYTVPTGGQDIGLPELVAAFHAQVPTDPCRRYELAGIINIADALAEDITNFPSKYQVLFNGLTLDNKPTQIGGRLDGFAWGPVGERPDTDPFYAQKVCAISID